MAYADEKAGIVLKINKTQRYIDFVEGDNSNTYGPYGENYDGSGTPDASDTVAAAHRWTGVGGGDAYFAWWRAKFSGASLSSTGVELVVYKTWKDWEDNGSNVEAQEGAESLAKLKSDMAAMQVDADALQLNIDNDAPDIAL